MPRAVVEVAKNLNAVVANNQAVYYQIDNHLGWAMPTLHNLSLQKYEICRPN